MMIKFLPKLNDLCFALTNKGFYVIENNKTKNNVYRFVLHKIEKYLSLIKINPRTKESIFSITRQSISTTH